MDTVHVEIYNDGSCSIDGLKWYTRDAYIRESGKSPKSVQIPYTHVNNGQSLKMKVLETTVFRPKNGFSEIKNKKSGRKRLEASK